MFQGTPTKADACVSMEEPHTCHVLTMTADLTGGLDTYAHNAPAADLTACHQLVC